MFAVPSLSAGRGACAFHVFTEISEDSARNVASPLSQKRKQTQRGDVRCGEVMEGAAELAGTARSSHRRAKAWGLDFPSRQTRQIPTGFTVEGSV